MTFTKPLLFSGYTGTNLNMLTRGCSLVLVDWFHLNVDSRNWFLIVYLFKCSVFWFQRCLFRRICTLLCVCVCCDFLTPSSNSNEVLARPPGIASQVWLGIPLGGGITALLHQSALNIQTWSTSGKLQAQGPHLVLETNISAPQDDSIFIINEMLQTLTFCKREDAMLNLCELKNWSHLLSNAVQRNEKAAADQ